MRSYFVEDDKRPRVWADLLSKDMIMTRRENDGGEV
jgi:hypothetical protein